MQRFKICQAVFILMIGSLFMLFGCGGGGGSTLTAPGANPGATGTGMISGTAVKGPVNSGTVMAYAVTNGTKGVELASAMTDSQGNFSMTINGYDGPVMLVMSGGTYTDEATGTMMAMGAGDAMTALLPMMSSGATITGIKVTPLTSMAQAMAGAMASGMTTTNSEAANTAIGHYFMVNDILHTMPMNPLAGTVGTGTTQDMINYGMTLATMTEYAKTLGMTDSSGIVTAMMKDASDGVMNGMMGGSSITMGGGMSMMGGGTMMPSTAEPPDWRVP